MIFILEILLYLLSLVIINSFFIYPIVIYLIGKSKIEKHNDENYLPAISIMIAAYNEEKVIADRIKNIAAQDYDFSKVEVFVGSDASTDDTNHILTDLQKEYSWLQIFLSEKRIGKAGILNELISKVKNEILVFTDANTEFKKDTLKILVRDFSDSKVGGVCGRLVLLDNENAVREGVEETKYWKYETFIKTYEGSCGLSLAANGGIFAIRKNLFQSIPVDKAVTDDLFISLSVVSKGFKFTYNKDALAYEETGKNISAEFNRKVRFSATNFQTLSIFRNLLLNNNIFLSYAFLSHKVTRWFLPMLLLAVFILSWILVDESIVYFILFGLQIMFYAFAIVGFFLSHIKVQNPFFSIPYFFTLLNVAVAVGFYKFLKKKHSVIWSSTER
jgi:cellulose synthase/poly-beta-1,6-N-acetylglucosamine synthase-like glycosyltransferase